MAIARAAYAVIVTIIVLMTAGVANSSAPADADWLALAVSGENTIGLGALIESTEVWPVAIQQQPMLRDAIASGQLQFYPYMYEHKGDYLWAVVYPADDTSWTLTADTRVVLAYNDTRIASLEIILLNMDKAAMQLGSELYSSRSGITLTDTDTRLARSTSGGFRGFVRFPPGALPRSEAKFLWFGGNKWGVKRPDSAYVERGGTDEPACPDPPDGRGPHDGPGAVDGSDNVVLHR
ncbi:MAG: hypothetical protein OCU12_07125 [Methanophagales archaeon]|nr:hypothetical protein [Methanophagales archaeon]